MVQEVDVLLRVAREMGVKPTAGIRIKLSTAGSGRWAESAGEASKFGLNPAQLVRAMDKLKAADSLDVLKLVHFHLGSQIPDIRNIKAAMTEVARYYKELRAMGAEITHVDVGGGLGIDYEGSRSNRPSSINYSLREYAADIVYTLHEGKLAVVNVTILDEKPGFQFPTVAENNYIDKAVFAKLRTLRRNPSELCPDEIFLRRAWLDLLGILPTAQEAQSFVADKHRSKRSRLIEELLERPEFADFWALKWSDLLRSEERVLDQKGVHNFYRWIRQSIAENKPLASARSGNRTHPVVGLWPIALREWGYYWSSNAV
jgi:hypothetical protein